MSMNYKPGNIISDKEYSLLKDVSKEIKISSLCCKYAFNIGFVAGVKYKMKKYIHYFLNE